MNVLHISPLLQAGGVRQLAADLACRLEGGGVACNFVMGPSGNLSSRLAAARIQHVSDARGYFTTFRNGSKLRRFLLKTHIDVIMAYTEQSAWLAGRVCRNLSRSQRPRIVGIATAYPRKSPWNGAWEYCDAITAISRHLRSELEKSAPVFRRKTPWVIPYGVEESVCFPGYTPTLEWMDEWKKRHSFSYSQEKTLSLCMPAPITPLHGHEALVPLLTALRRNGCNAHVYIVGDTAKADSRYLLQIKESLQAARLNGSVSWLGVRADLRDVLSACDITISLDTQPATYNRPILEALALGKPVVGYDHGVVEEFLGSFMPEGRIAPGQIDALADTITQWSFYLPTPVDKVPYPYRMDDTVANYLELFRSLF